MHIRNYKNAHNLDFCSLLAWGHLLFIEGAFVVLFLGYIKWSLWSLSDESALQLRVTLLNLLGAVLGRATRFKTLELLTATICCLMLQTLCLEVHTFRDLKWLWLGYLGFFFEIDLIGLWLHGGGESGASRLMPRWTLVLFSRLLSDAAVLALILLCDPFTVCWKSLLLLITFSCICFNSTGLFDLFLRVQLLNLRSRVRD